MVRVTKSDFVQAMMYPNPESHQTIAFHLYNACNQEQETRSHNSQYMHSTNGGTVQI